jgi:hypothetical protein
MAEIGRDYEGEQGWAGRIQRMECQGFYWEPTRHSALGGRVAPWDLEKDESWIGRIMECRLARDAWESCFPMACLVGRHPVRPVGAYAFESGRHWTVEGRLSCRNGEAMCNWNVTDPT